MSLPVRSRPFADDGLPRPLPEGQLAAAVIERLDTSGPPVPIRRMTAVGETDDAALPADFSLGRVYPNPFNAATLIPFQVPAGDAAARALTLRVYNLLGQPVRTLVEGVLPPGQQVARWDGRADNGRPLASGVYVARLQAGGVLASTKLLYVR